MALRAAGSVFGVFLLSVAGVLGENVWDVTFTRTRICALKGLSVDVSCTYRYPSGHDVIDTEWYKWWNVKVGYTYNIMEQPEYAGRVEYLGNNHSDCTLRITDLRENDTAEYCFGFKTNIQGWIYQQDLFISVTDLKVTTYVTKGSWVILNCSTTCTLSDNPNPDYIWYKNGKPQHEYMSQNYSTLSSDVDSYSCAVKGNENHRSPAVCAVGQNCWRVIYAKKSICALKGSSVDISCTYTYPHGHIPRETFWFTQGESTKEPKDLKKDPNYLDRLEYHGNEDSDCTLRIKDLKDSDSAEYKFRLVTAEGKYVSSPGVYLTVTGVLLEMNPMSVSEGERAKLTCTANCILGDNTTFIWYKNRQAIPNSHNYSNSLHLYPVSSDDAGSYSCAVNGHEDLHSPEVTLTVRYKPNNILVSISPSGEIVEGSSVILTCHSDANPPVQKYTWYMRNINTSKESSQIYSITNIRSEDSGEYYCEAQNEMGAKNSTVTLILVSGKQTFSINIAVGITVVALVLNLLLSFLWFRKRASNSTDTRDTAEDGQGGSSHLYDTILRTAPTAAQNADTDEQDVRIYANVHFSHSRNHEEALYSPVQLRNPEKQDKVQYAALKFNRLGVAPHPAAHAAEDSSAIYSTVNKPRTRTQEGTLLSSYPTFPRPPTGSW
ncbi:B-cell receptor CD22-like [Salmo salar]|uniref:B-cell receptor CD22 n=1 Tax=Salmo salar TaxID=8030 RepID=A0A1S3LHP8_SALSA|nr:B-cell receptor CD22-like [Salmo salar]